LVSCLVAGREPWKPGGDAEMPSIRLVLYRGVQGKEAVPVWWPERKLQLLGDEAAAVLWTWSVGGGLGKLLGGRAGALEAGW
jgi:hypothetical protein